MMMAKADQVDVSRVRRSLSQIEDLRERNNLVQSAVKAASTDDEQILLMATILSDYIKTMGQVTALELLATLGWWLLEQDGEDGHH